MITAYNEILSIGTVSGGVSYNSVKSDEYNAYYTVTGNGSITDGWWGCFVEGTNIVLSDKTTKKVEDITYDDELLVWDFYEGKQSFAKPIWIKQPELADYYYKVTLEGGTVLNLVGSNGKSHRLYDYEKHEFAYPQDMGRDHTVTMDYRGLHIESIERIDKPIKYYNIITDKHYNLYAEGILTSCRISNRYGIK